MVTRIVSESSTVNSRRFGSPPAEICGDLLKVATARNPPRCTPVREGRAVVVASPPVARWWPVGVPARRHEAVTRHGRGFQLCWCWLAWHADLAPDRAEWATTRRAPAGRCAWAVRGVLVRAWLRDASLMVRAHVLCSTSRATCTDPPATPTHRDYHARRPDLRRARHRWRARPRPRPRLHPPWPPRPCLSRLRTGRLSLLSKLAKLASLQILNLETLPLYL